MGRYYHKMPSHYILWLLTLGSGRTFYIKPFDKGFEWVKADEMAEIDIDGKLITGKGIIPGEKFIHLGVFRARKDVGSVIHVHPKYSIILSTVFAGSIVIVGQQSVHFTGQIPLYIDASLINTREQGDDVAKVMGTNPVLLMKNHASRSLGGPSKKPYSWPSVLNERHRITSWLASSESRVE